MADEQQSPQPQSFLEKINTPIKELWENNKGFIIVFGVLILIIKFREVIIDVLLSSAKKTFEDAKAKDGQLLADENKAKDQANKLVDESKQLSENKPKVDEDWYKNGK